MIGTPLPAANTIPSPRSGLNLHKPAGHCRSDNPAPTAHTCWTLSRPPQRWCRWQASCRRGTAVPCRRCPCLMYRNGFHVRDLPYHPYHFVFFFLVVLWVTGSVLLKKTKYPNSWLNSDKELIETISSVG